jgi:hypothetical protein
LLLVAVAVLVAVAGVRGRGERMVSEERDRGGRERGSASQREAGIDAHRRAAAYS